MARVAFRFTGNERRIDVVPRWVMVMLVAALALHAGWQWTRGRPAAEAAALPLPPRAEILTLASAGEPILAAQLLTLYLQAFDNQPGISIPFAQLDYTRVAAWLAAALHLDPRSQYPLMMAGYLYAQVPDEPRQRKMLALIHEAFRGDPDRRWRWLAHAAIMAKHRLKDMPLALRYAEDITRHARGASNWARQMRIFILEDMGELHSAAVLLGGLLDSGEVTDPAEIRFLTERLGDLKTVEKSSSSPKSRRSVP